MSLSEERGRSHYVAVYRHPEPDSARMLLRRVVIDYPFGLIPPPTISLHKPLDGPHEFAHAGDGTQAEIAKLYGVSQQTIGRWIAYTEEYDAEGPARRAAELRAEFEADPAVQVVHGV